MPSADVAVCVDFGSTFTKASLVDLDAGRIVARAEHPTTIGTDLLEGYDACLAELTDADARAVGAEVLACSSAGGGLRIAVVGNEELVTAEAGRRVALSSGGKVVAVIASASGVALERLGEPDVVLLTGGTDGGNTEAITTAARDLVRSRLDRPGGGGRQRRAHGPPSRRSWASVPHVLADNVVPTIGVLAPEGARAAIREMFLAHVIGGKHLSARDEFTAMVRGATPDVVLTGVEVLARAAGDVVVVDIGGATTDVHSVVKLDPEDAGLSREVVATTPVTRTVEGDLGMRWSAVSTAAASRRLVPRLLRNRAVDDLSEAATRRAAEPGFVPDTDAERDEDERLAAPRPRAWRCAGTPVARGWWSAPRDGWSSAAARTCARCACWSARAGCCGTAAQGVAERVLGPSTGADLEGGWQLPEAPDVVVDADYVLAAVGLLAASDPKRRTVLR